MYLAVEMIMSHIYKAVKMNYTFCIYVIDGIYCSDTGNVLLCCVYKVMDIQICMYIYRPLVGPLVFILNKKNRRHVLVYKSFDFRDYWCITE